MKHLVVLVLMTAMLGGACSGDTGPDDTMAFVMCQDFVKDRLRAPATAGFPLSYEATITPTGTDQWQIASHVDSENGFGARIRTQFVCEIRYVGDDTWRLVSLDFQE